ncbi:unnamed protein product [Rotaria magnacalcarata]|uniref:Uncharacterized protein n=1 Tax=Rotaria magnacalcarata TaxID=392030 RepID=A0A820B820_9BILA|nr:unnamed protein product [Rotaria magnacalcarata]CAF1605508.1 unnamed protein product [Rotaria magnacalcarata]CAF2033511.1 unnamed protein product [Rotaria magnacalcarata]CAF2048592.1 unnamed protein product [Rotaria magnacalcarata]CAF2236056.1 unnamed protein product [Rotaria magnacalcarata]
MSNQNLNDLFMRFFLHDESDTRKCRKCKKFLAQGASYPVCSECNETSCLTSSDQIEPSCCVPVTCEQIDHDTLVHVKRLRWNNSYNRGYCTKSCTKHNMTSMHTYWEGQLSSSPERFPYFVPSNWYRLSLHVDFASIPYWGSNWHTLYHGTHPQNIHKIVENGFLIRQCQHGFPALYLSPSIIYSSHPRYARVVVQNGTFFQFVLEVRVDIRKLQPLKKRETLSVGTVGDVDPHFPNNEDLEFLLKAEEGKFLKPHEGVVVTGVMVRKINFDPALLQSSWWWCKWRNLAQLHRFYYNGMTQTESTN